MRNLMLLMAGGMLALSFTASAVPGDPVFETCPETGDIGDNVECYPVTITSKTPIHPFGIPIIGYLFVPTDTPDEPLPAIVFAHGSSSMYSSGNHNKGLNSKHVQWVREYTGERGIVTFHVSSFHSRYLLPDSPGDQRIFDIEMIPDGIVGGDDYRAMSTVGGLHDEDDDISSIPLFDPEQDGWKDQSNGRAGISEIIGRPYDSDAAWDFLAGIRKGRFITSSRNEDDAEPTLGSPATGIGFISEIVRGGLSVDHERIFFSGTSHGGQTVMAVSHAPRALSDDNPMNADLPAGFNRKRYAGFFDYYGGCGLYGAYGGAKHEAGNPSKSSTWRPYAPFLMLHGELDEIWQESDTGTTREKWLAGECYPRIASAKADPDFDVFLEAVIYEGAHHSFDGISRGDFDDEEDVDEDDDYNEWIAKIHANERMTLGMMDAIGDIVSARRNSAPTVPTLADFGFNEHNPYFSTFPLVPPLAPRIDFKRSALGVTNNGIIHAPVNKNVYDTGAITFVYVRDPAGVHDVSCGIVGDPVEVTATDIHTHFNCRLNIDLTTAQTDALDAIPYRFTLSTETPLGVTYTPVEISGDGVGGGQVRIFQAYSTLPDTITLLADIDSSDKITVDARALAWSWFPALYERYATIIEASVMGGGLDMDDSMIVGPKPSSGGEASILSLRGHGSEKRQLGMSFHDAGNQAEISAIGFGVSLDPAPLAPLDAPDFDSQFVALTPVDSSIPLLPGEFPAGTLPPGSGGGSGGGGSGGGAFLWLLPIALLMRKRN